MNKKQNCKNTLYLFLTLFLLVVAVISGWDILPAYADTSIYTNVLVDLQKDSNFNAEDYPEITNDYSINVIQIAESESGELFLYTYQPCQNTLPLQATEINMTLSDTAGSNLDGAIGGVTGGTSQSGFNLYSLKLINKSGLFCKYKVNGIAVSNDAIRYYNIASIYRKWDTKIDGTTGTNNTGEKKAYTVGKCYAALTLDDKVYYHCSYKETIEIENPYADYLRYSNGFKFFPNSCDGHYIAFSTNRQIDRLIEATVYYKQQVIFMNNPYGDTETKTVKLSEIDEASNEADGWFAEKHTWKRIESVNEFIANEDLTSDTEKIIENMQWVLRFAETSYSTFKGTNGFGDFKSYTQITEVSILQLEFETDGVCYNLGAVSDAVSGDELPGNVEIIEEDWFTKIIKFFENIWNKINGFDLWQWLLFVVLAIFGIGIVISFIIFGINAVVKAVVTFILWLIKKALQSVIWLLGLPFRCLAALFGKESGHEK